MIFRKYTLTFVTAFCLSTLVSAQSAITQVLFLGNSYTYANNLPKLLTDIAQSTGDTIITDENTPGGHTLMAHASNPLSLAKIKAANWDYVVLQDQSQLPSFPEADVNEMVYPFARKLDSLIHANYTCSQTVFYMTWGRKNGDAQNCATWPPVCTYQGMDSLLAMRYNKMAKDNKALVSPVGALWKYLRTNFPTLELYELDESHPSLAGSYAAACSFYTTILKKDPTNITYNAGLNPTQAAIIREATKIVVYQNLGTWNIGTFTPKAHFNAKFNHPNPKMVQFDNLSENGSSYFWDFGDGDTSTVFSPQHLYKSSGNYSVTLTTFYCNLFTKYDSSITITNTGQNDIGLQPLTISPNPSFGVFTVKSGDNTHYEIAIYGSLGNLVYKKSISSTSSTIDLSNEPKGIYFILIKNKDVEITGKRILIE